MRDFGLSFVGVMRSGYTAASFKSVQQQQVRARVGAIGCMNDTPRRERREIRGNGLAHAVVSRGNIHTYCGQAVDFRVLSEFEAFRPMRYMSYSD